MSLISNQLFRLNVNACELTAGIYRVVWDEPLNDLVICARLSEEAPSKRPRGGRPRATNPKRGKRYTRPPMVGALHKANRQELNALQESHDLVLLSLELASVYYTPFKNQKEEEQFKRRCQVMADFLDFGKLREGILLHGNMGGLVRQAMKEHGASRNYVYRLWSTLCVFGFTTTSLRTRWDLCGAKGQARDLDKSTNGPRQKAGRKTLKQRISMQIHGHWGDPVQPGMSDVWRVQIKAAYKRIPIPKPSMRECYKQIIAHNFTTGMRYDENHKIVAVDLEPGQYPNYPQVKRVLTVETSALQKILDKTSKGHFKRSLRGLHSCSWEGSAGPGLTYAIDSTIGDIYLRSSINPAWIVGRPIVYIIVDVWSTAIVGFYVCLEGPSWDTAQVSLFNTAASPELLSSLWGYEMQQSLYPAPTLPARLLCDRGEYLSKRAKATGMKLIRDMQYTPPFRPDLKGIVEVMHRILKNAQHDFLPGAMDARRAEYEFRRSNPAEATMSVRQYMQYLHECFFRYNLTANRTHRVDAHMAAAGVFPSPGGLWRWGHAMGIGYSRATSMPDLVTQLLPQGCARTTRQGVRFRGNYYQSPIIDAEHWSTLARSAGGGWELPAQYYPGSVSHIWTPNVSGNGLIELKIADHANASPEISYAEMADAFAFQQMKAADVEHECTYQAVLSLKRMEAIRARSIEETVAALSRARGRNPSISEAREMENKFSNQLSVGETRGSRKARETVKENYSDILDDLFAAMDGKADDAR